MDPGLTRQLADLVRDEAAFVHVTHVNPDSDGVGSALAMHRWLRSLGKRSEVVLPSPLPRKLAFLPRPGEIRIASGAGPGLPPDAACLIYDVSTLRRLGPFEAGIRASTRPVVVFDHHDAAIDFPALAFVDPAAGATGQVLFDLLEALGASMTLDLAIPLYVAILADTGSFNYGKTTPHTHHVAARLLEAGVDPLEVHGALEGSRSLQAIRTGGEVLRTLTVDAGDARIAHATMTLEQFEDGGADAIDMLDLVNHVISLHGVRAGALLVEAAPAATRLSMRSKGATSIVEVARSFGGGGHRNAAGATLQGAPDAVREQVLQRLRAAIADQHGPPSA